MEDPTAAEEKTAEDLGPEKVEEEAVVKETKSEFLVSEVEFPDPQPTEEEKASTGEVSIWASGSGGEIS